MGRTETVELTVLCLIQDGEKILLQNRVKEDWKGYTLPGGHVEIGESFVDAVKREMKEETGLTILNPRIVGIKQFPMKNGNYEEGRYVVLLFKVTEFTGEVISSAEGQMEWISYDHISEIDTVDDFDDLLEVMNDSNLTEFQYIVDGDDWNVLKK
ncbi:MAG: 8-oxo-dGTP diphosphatase [Butyrivibrio sp.]|nr:8-oxo-dGTP diphosphatase [Butyrivibrio sp.]